MWENGTDLSIRGEPPRWTGQVSMSEERGKGKALMHNALSFGVKRLLPNWMGWGSELIVRALVCLMFKGTLERGWHNVDLLFGSFLPVNLMDMVVDFDGQGNYLWQECDSTVFWQSIKLNSIAAHFITLWSCHKYTDVNQMVIYMQKKIKRIDCRIHLIPINLTLTDMITISSFHCTNTFTI